MGEFTDRAKAAANVKSREVTSDLVKAEVIEDGQSDKAGRQVVPRRRQPMTAKQRRAAEERLKDPSAPEYQIALRGGYSPWSARNPGRDIQSFKFADQLALERGMPLTQVGPSVLAELALDDQQAGSTRGAAAARLAELFPQSGDDQELTQEQSRVVLAPMQLEAAVRAAEMALRYGARVLPALRWKLRMAKARAAEQAAQRAAQRR